MPGCLVACVPCGAVEQRPRLPLTPLQYVAKMLPGPDSGALSGSALLLEGRGASTDSALTRTDSGSGSGQLVAVVDAETARAREIALTSRAGREEGSGGLTLFGPPPTQGSGTDQLVLHRNLWVT